MDLLNQGFTQERQTQLAMVTAYIPNGLMILIVTAKSAESLR